MIQTIKQNKKAVLAFLLALVMVIGLIPFTATEAHAMTVDATGENVVWEAGDSFTLVLANKIDPTKTETHTVTYDGEKWSTFKSAILPAYAFAHIGEVNKIEYKNGEWSYTPVLKGGYNVLADLADADVMVATSEVKAGADLSLKFEHCFSKVSFHCSLNTEFDSGTDRVTGLRVSDSNVIAYHEADAFEAIIAPREYAEGENLATVTVNNRETFVSMELTVKVPEGGLTFEAGKHYTFNLKVGKEVAVIDLSQYSDGATVDITQNSVIVGDGNEYNVSLNIAEDAIVTLDVGTGGVKLTAPITVADGKTLTLLVAGDAEHIVNGGISLGNGSNVIIEGDLTKENNKLTVTATGGNAGIGANNGVRAGNVTIRNARVDATGSSKEVSADSNMIIRADTSISGAAIGTSDGSMGDILIENSIIVAEGGYYENTSHAPAIGIGYVGSTMGNITLINSQITARNNGDGLASVIGAGANHYVFASGSLGDIVITNTELNLSMAVSTKNWYAAVIGSGIGFSHGYVNMGKIIFTDVTQAELDEMIPTWLPSDFNESQGYALGRGNDGSIYKYDAFGGVWVSDGNGGTVQIGDESGYHNPE